MAEKGQKSIKIDGFPTFQKSGKSFFYCKNGLIDGKPVKIGHYSYGEIGQL